MPKFRVVGRGYFDGRALHPIGAVLEFPSRPGPGFEPVEEKGGPAMAPPMDEVVPAAGVDGGGEQSSGGGGKASAPVGAFPPPIPVKKGK